MRYQLFPNNLSLKWLQSGYAPFTAAILANAFVFHEALADGPGALSEVASLDEVRGKGRLNKSGVLAEWRKILKANYWPDVARRVGSRRFRLED